GTKRNRRNGLRGGTAGKRCGREGSRDKRHTRLQNALVKLQRSKSPGRAHFAASARRSENHTEGEPESSCQHDAVLAGCVGGSCAEEYRSSRIRSRARFSQKERLGSDHRLPKRWRRRKCLFHGRFRGAITALYFEPEERFR